MKFHPLNSTRQIVLLAPAQTCATSEFPAADDNPARHAKLLKSLQRLRGRVYLADGAIQPADLTTDARHEQAADNFSWHVLSVDSDDAVQGCARLRPYSPYGNYSDLSAYHTDIARTDRWSNHLHRAINAEVKLARDRGIKLAEVGGWALTDELRHGTEALRIALATYALGQRLGGCIGFTTATVRHCSAMILRRLGGCLLRDGELEIPRYFDERYGCEMEVLRFDSSAPSEKYSGWVVEAASHLAMAPVVTSKGGHAKAAAAAAFGFRPSFGFAQHQQSALA
jgi:hypothetical protein